MYRGVLGDCFLLTHERGQAKFHALIDCGVLQCIGDRPKTKAALAHLPEIVADLKTTTNGVLDLVIATHEHFDHLSGFLRENDAFATFEMRRLWLAWTENPADKEANDIQARGRKAISALKGLVAQPALAADDDEAADRLKRIEALMQFYDDDPTPAPTAFGAAAPARVYDPANKPRSCADVIDWLTAKVGADKVSYLEPGQRVSLGLDDALTAYVLGPPRSARLLQLDPSAGDQREVYLVKADEAEAVESAVRARTLAMTPAEDRPEPAATDYPFDGRFGVALAKEADHPLAALYYEGAAERRIDGDWLGSAELLALKIDGDVNNTSLALAIEAPGPDRHVLLFPADAQVGNWLSWHDQKYPADAKAGETQQTAADLLKRVVLYKVGHHGSHNATAAEKGLELMTSPNLVAMIPVVVEVAQEQTSKNVPKGWAMPYADLAARLAKVTRSRVVMGDGQPDAERAAFAAAPGLFELAYEGGAAPVWVELSMTIKVEAPPTA